MSSYNGEQYIDEQIESILLQKGCKVKLLVRDDGSTDSTKEILEKYHRSGKLDWYTGENLKPAKSFMHLLTHCSKQYDYYAFSDQDDVWDADKLSIAIQKIRNSIKPCIYCSNAELVDADLNLLSQHIYKHSPNFTFERVLLMGAVQGATMVFNQKLATYFDQRVISSYIPMHDFYVSCVCMGVGGNIIFDDESHIKYRQHEKNVLGIRLTFKSKLKEKVSISFKHSILYDLEALSRHLLEEYNSELDDKAVAFLNLTKNYRHSLRKKLKIIFMSNFKTGRLNQAIIYRLAILMGNL